MLLVRSFVEQFAKRRFALRVKSELHEPSMLEWRLVDFTGRFLEILENDKLKLTKFNLLKQKLVDLQKQTAEMESLQKKIADLEKQRVEATVIDTPTKERSIPAPR